MYKSSSCVTCSSCNANEEEDAVHRNTDRALTTNAGAGRRWSKVVYLHQQIDDHNVTANSHLGAKKCKNKCNVKRADAATRNYSFVTLFVSTSAHPPSYGRIRDALLRARERIP
ncbi:unnamed protein product [Cylicocyclus nassatus]|uniref:Uncharacterized protein n=1 Tax=Cylicocyclus nassatus TaxID=53992 RepID=A0AA36MF89_CYLNA|nr:unnamed protein product [Cylicocyclus nassatus]